MTLITLSLLSFGVAALFSGANISALSRRYLAEIDLDWRHCVNAILMTYHKMPMKFGPVLAGGSWYSFSLSPRFRLQASHTPRSFSITEHFSSSFYRLYRSEKLLRYINRSLIFCHKKPSMHPYPKGFAEIPTFLKMFLPEPDADENQVNDYHKPCDSAEPVPTPAIMDPYHIPSYVIL